MAGILKRTIRGIRDSLPPGYVVGRLSNAEGPAELIDLRTLTIAQQTVMGGQLSSPQGGVADFGIFVSGKPLIGNMILFEMQMTKGLKLYAGLTGGQFGVNTAPTADYTVTLKKNGASIGTIKFAAGTGTVSAVFATDITLAITDKFQIVGPATPDATVADLWFGFAATFA